VRYLVEQSKKISRALPKNWIQRQERIRRAPRVDFRYRLSNKYWCEYGQTVCIQGARGTPETGLELLVNGLEPDGFVGPSRRKHFQRTADRIRYLG
jgi:hypothetical protein